MRRLPHTVIALGLLLSGGCASWSKHGDPIGADVQPLPEQLPTTENLVNYLNVNAEKLNSIEASKLSISTRVQGGSRR